MPRSADAILQQQSAVCAIVARACGAATRLVGIARLPDFQAIVARRDARLHDCADLRQRRVGLPSACLQSAVPRAEALRAFTAALESKGLNYHELDGVDLPPAEAHVRTLPGAYAAEINALTSGAVDAVYVRGPAGLEAARVAGARMLVDISGHADPWLRAHTALLRVVTVSEPLLWAYPKVISQELLERWPLLPARLSLEESALGALEMLKDFLARWAFIRADFSISSWIDGGGAPRPRLSLVV